QHQGFILVSSQTGHGTTIQIFLPTSGNTPEPSVAEPSDVSAHQGTETILLVEDDEAVHHMMSKVLEEYGYHVLQATSGAAALLVWERSVNPIHILLTDIVMPGGMNGIELAVKIREKNPDLKVIFTSGYNPNWTERNLKLPEGSIYLQKPCSFEQILKTVRQCLDNS
ncbi:MAG TPA: response regulator, partial [Acidobacteriota bacterium]|nr:response regulator [Acidobacteriota bacterium]